MTMQEHEEALKDVHSVLERLKYDGKAVEFTLKSGIVLRCKPVPPLYVRALREQFIPPPPPMVHIDRGEDSFDEPNADDPNYKAELDRLSAREDIAVTRFLLGMGTEFVSAPADVFAPADDGWIAHVQKADKFTGVCTPLDLSDDDMRYVSWLTFYALDNNADLQLAGLYPQWLAGVSEGEVAQALDAFRDLQRQRADTNGTAAVPPSNGTGSNRAARRRRS